MIPLLWYRMSFPYILCAGPEQNCLIRLFESFPDSNPSRYEYGSGSDPESRPSLRILDPVGNNARSGRIGRTTASQGRIRKYGSVENTFFVKNSIEVSLSGCVVDLDPDRVGLSGSKKSFTNESALFFKENVYKIFNDSFCYKM